MTDDKEQELLPCPFCNAIAENHADEGWAEIDHGGKCYLRRVQDSSAGKGRFLIADIAAWNTRAPQIDEVSAALDELREMFPDVPARIWKQERFSTARATDPDYCDFTVSLAEPTGSKAFSAPTLEEAMNQVRQYSEKGNQ